MGLLLLVPALFAACRDGPAEARSDPDADAEIAATARSPADSLIARGEAVYWEGEIERAREWFQAALDESRRRADPAAEASALTWLGNAAYRLGEYEDARRLGEQALAMKLELGLHDQLFRSYNALGLLAWNESRYFDALELFGSALEIAAAEGDSLSLAKVWTNLGLVRTDLGDFPEARRLFLKALPVARALDEGLVEGRILSNLGALEVRTGDPLAALAPLRAGLARQREVEDAVGEQNALGQLGTAYAAMGEPGLAIAHLDSALHRSREQGLRQEEATNLEQLAEVYRGAGEFRQALRLLEQAKAINAELGLDDETGMDLRSEAEIHASLGNAEAGLRLAGEALEIHRRVGSRLEELTDRILLADLAHRAGRPAEARAHLEAASRLAATLEARKVRASVALAVARNADREGDARAVLRVLRESREEIAGGGHDVEWEAPALEARAHARLGDLESAAARGREAVAAVERVRGQHASGILRTSYLAEREEVYRDLVGWLLALGRVEEAFEIADAARARVLVEHLAVERANGAATARELAEEERQLLKQIDDMAVLVEETRGGNGAGAEHRADLGRLYAELERTRGEYAAVLLRTTRAGSREAALAGGEQPDAARVRAALGPDEALIEYLVGPDELRGFVVTRAGVGTFRVEVARSQLAARVRLARELVGRPESDPEVMGPVLERLHETLLGPAIRSGALEGVRTLVIVPHGELSYVPFPALRDPESGRWLAEDHALLHLPSAVALPVLRGRERVRASGGAIAFAPFPGDLPATLREARAVRGDAVRGRKATEARFRRALAEDGVVHAATHGILNVRNPLFSRLKFARGDGAGPEDDGRLEVHELLDLPVAASLVFLSGCETGLGAAWTTAFGRGEDYATLARAFLYAGADNVVATLWRVEDEGAAVIASQFYRDLAEAASAKGDAPASVALALARAQQALIADRRYAAPYYWAGYRVSGSGRIDPTTLRRRRWIFGAAPRAAQNLAGLSVLEGSSPAIPL